MTKVEYCTVSGSTETVYKTVNLGYASTKVNGLDGYAIGSITSSDKFQSTITYDNDAFNGKVLSVINRTTTDGVPGTGTGTVLFSLEFAYDSSARKTTATNENGDQIVYLFNDEGNLTDHYIVKNGKVAEYSKYSYNAFGDSSVSIARSDLQNRYTPANFNFDAGSIETSTLNAFNKKVTTTKTIYPADTSAVTSETAYTYDDYLRCIKMETITSFYGVRALLQRAQALPFPAPACARFARKKDGRAVLFAFICIWFYARVWKSLASNVTVNSRASPPRETRMVSVSPSRSS